MNHQVETQQEANPFQKSWGVPATLTGVFVSLGTAFVLGLILGGARAIALLPVLMALTVIVLGVIFTIARKQWAEKFKAEAKTDKVKSQAEKFKEASGAAMFGYLGAAVLVLIVGLVMNAIGSAVNTLHPSSLFVYGALGVISYAAFIATLSWSLKGGVGKGIAVLVLGISSQLLTFALAAQQAWLDAGHFMN